MTPRIWTYYDLIVSLERVVRGWSGGSVSQDEIREAIQTAYEKIVTAHDWRCLRTPGRVTLRASVTGTASYDSATRQLTTTTAILDDDWMNDASVLIDDVLCDIEEVSSTTLCTLDATMCPRGDKTAESITIFPRYYPLPADFLSMGKPMEHEPWGLGDYVPLDEMLNLTNYNFQTGDVRKYSIGPAPDLVNTEALYVWPASDTTEEYTYPYRRRARELRYSGSDSACTVGTISATSGSATITGVSTTFDAAMVNSLLRIGSSTTVVPTGLDGKSPWVEQRAIKSVTDALHVVLDANVTNDRSGVKYCLTDPIDLNAGPYHALLAESKAQLAIDRSAKEWPALKLAAKEALLRAKESNSPVQQRRVIGMRNPPGYRLAYETERPTT